MDMKGKSIFSKAMGMLTLCAVGTLFYACDDEPTVTGDQGTSFEVSVQGLTSVAESSSGITATVKLDKKNETGQSLTIKYALGGTATSGTDYKAPSGVLSIANGASEATIRLELINDTDKEGDETVIITLLPDDLLSNISLSASKSVTITITDDDQDNGGGNSDYSVSIEGGVSTSEASVSTDFTIKLDKTNNTGSAINVVYTLSGTALAGTDYTNLSGTATIENGKSDVKVVVALIDDTEEEGNETIIVTLSSANLPSGVSLGTVNKVTLTITDDESPTVIACDGDNSISGQNIGCESTPDVTNTYAEGYTNDMRTITTNGIPNHSYTNQNPTADELNSDTKVYEVTTSPTKANAVTSVVNDGMPAWAFGVALNGVKFDPAPYTPFIFEMGDGEYNFDWVFEPTTNMTEVGLDCSGAHVQPDGSYHYHADPAEYANTILTGLGDGTATPVGEVQIGWAADGYPILYQYGKDASGTFRKLKSSYQVKAGNRPGDGDTEPCGEYNGKYTSDFEYVAGLGDLDECNGIDQTITIGNYTYNYYYVITEEFPVVPRCFTGNPNTSFKLGGGGNSGGGSGGGGGMPPF